MLHTVLRTVSPVPCAHIADFFMHRSNQLKDGYLPDICRSIDYRHWSQGEINTRNNLFEV